MINTRNSPNIGKNELVISEFNLKFKYDFIIIAL